mmetsp:Transcript_53807/g.139048  ORF Transcript_53807/g.139048 Transcript_53807/m.139048 type:complete len:327 (+) Transcript_53807:1468-2448(+)
MLLRQPAVVGGGSVGGSGVGSGAGMRWVGSDASAAGLGRGGPVGKGAARFRRDARCWLRPGGGHAPMALTSRWITASAIGATRASAAASAGSVAVLMSPTAKRAGRSTTLLGSSERYGKQIQRGSVGGGRSSPHARSMSAMAASTLIVRHSEASVWMRAHCCMRALKCSRPQQTPERVMPTGHGAPNSPCMTTYSHDSFAVGKTAASEDADMEHSGCVTSGPCAQLVASTVPWIFSSSSAGVLLPLLPFPLPASELAGADSAGEAMGVSDLVPSVLTPTRASEAGTALTTTAAAAPSPAVCVAVSAAETTTVAAAAAASPAPTDSS